MQLELKSRHQQILAFLHEFNQEEGFAPSIQEIGAAIGLKSTSSLRKYLQELEELGYIKRDPTKPRAIALTTVSPTEAEPFPQAIKEIPVLNNIAAGRPLLAQGQLIDIIPFPEKLVGNGDHFILKIQDNNIVEAKDILPGDYVIVSQQDYAENGDTIVTLLNDKVTIMHFYYEEKATVQLQPILGKVIGLFRQFI